MADTLVLEARTTHYLAAIKLDLNNDFMHIEGAYFAVGGRSVPLLIDISNRELRASVNADNT